MEKRFILNWNIDLTSQLFSRTKNHASILQYGETHASYLHQQETECT